jgi:hypothetical protein
MSDVMPADDAAELRAGEERHGHRQQLPEELRAACRGATRLAELQREAVAEVKGHDHEDREDEVGRGVERDPARIARRQSGR